MRLTRVFFAAAVLVLTVIAGGCSSATQQEERSTEPVTTVVDEVNETVVEEAVPDTTPEMTTEEEGAVNGGQEEESYTIGVTNNRVKFRTGPGTEWETIPISYRQHHSDLDEWDFLLQGQPVELLEERTNDSGEQWIRVSAAIADNYVVEGWVFGSYIEAHDSSLSERYMELHENDVLRLTLLETMIDLGIDASNDLIAMWYDAQGTDRLLIMGDTAMDPQATEVSHAYVIRGKEDTALIGRLEGFRYYGDQEGIFDSVDTDGDGTIDGYKIQCRVFGLPYYHLEDTYAGETGYELIKSDITFEAYMESETEVVTRYLLMALMMESGAEWEDFSDEMLECFVGYNSHISQEDYNWSEDINYEMLGELIRSNGGSLRLVTAQDTERYWESNNYITLEKLTNGEYMPIGRFRTFTGVLPWIREVHRTRELTDGSATISEDGKTIRVHNADELVYHMAPDRHFLLEPGDYDLSGVDQGLNIPYYNHGFYNLENVTFEGVGAEQVDFLTHDWEDEVIRFYDCSNIRLENLYVGHSPSVFYEYCAGGVLMLQDVENVRVDECTLFGCGTVGITALDVKGLNCTETVITDCSRSIVEFESVEEVNFEGCIFENDGDQDFELTETYEVIFDDCEFTGYIAEYPQINLSGFEGIELPNDGHYHTVDLSLPYQIELTNCSFGGLMLESLLANELGEDAFEFDIWHDWQDQEQLSITVTYEAYLPASEYLKEIQRVKALIGDATEHDYNVHVNLQLRGENETSDIITMWGGELSIPVNTDAAEVMDDGRRYLTADEAAGQLMAQLPPTYRVDGLSEELDTGYLEHVQTLILEGDLYYGYQLIDGNIDSDYSYFYADAVTGIGYVNLYGGNMDGISAPKSEQVTAIFDYLESLGEEIPEDGRYKALVYGEGVVQIFTDFTWNDIFWVFEEDGVYRAYYWEGGC